MKLKFFKTFLFLLLCCLSTKNSFASDSKLISYSEDLGNWNKIITGSKGWNGIDSLAIDNNGNVYAAGIGENLISKNSKYDLIIKKYNQSGIEDIKNWNKVIDIDLKSDRISSIGIDKKNNVYIIGYSTDIETKQVHLIIKKFQQNGKGIYQNWNKKINLNSQGDIVPQSNSIVFDSENNVYVIGFINQNWDNTNKDGNCDWLIKKFNENGIEVKKWNKIIDNKNGYDWPLSIAIDSKDNIFISGIGDDVVINKNRKHKSNLDYDLWIKKFDKNGNEDLTNWNKKIDGNGNWDWAYSLTIDNNDNVFMGGFGCNLLSEYSSYDWWIKKFTNDGTEFKNWNKILGDNDGQDCIYSTAVDSNGNLIVAGFGITKDREYIRIRFFSSTGNYEQEIIGEINGNYKDFYISSIVTDKYDNLYFAGFIKNEEYKSGRGYLKKLVKGN